MSDIYQQITDRIIAELEKGKIPWHCPWRPIEWRHRNLVSKKPYRGINAILLCMTSYESPFWLSMRQIRQLGGTMIQKYVQILMILSSIWISGSKIILTFHLRDTGSRKLIVTNTVQKSIMAKSKTHILAGWIHILLSKLSKYGSMPKLHSTQLTITNNERTGIYVKKLVFNHDFRGLRQ